MKQQKHQKKRDNKNESKRKSKITRKVGMAALLLAFAFAGAVAHASDIDRATRLTFGQAVEIPGHTLPAGTYWFVRAGHGDFPNVNAITVYNEDRTDVVATVNTQYSERRDPSDDIVLTFVERGTGQPIALTSFTYPGLVTGNRFVYPEKDRRELSEYREVTAMVTDNGATFSNENPSERGD